MGGDLAGLINPYAHVAYPLFIMAMAVSRPSGTVNLKC